MLSTPSRAATIYSANIPRVVFCSKSEKPHCQKSETVFFFNGLGQFLNPVAEFNKVAFVGNRVILVLSEQHKIILKVKPYELSIRFFVQLHIRVNFDYFWDFVCCSRETFVDYEYSFDALNGECFVYACLDGGLWVFAFYDVACCCCCSVG